MRFRATHNKFSAQHSDFALYRSDFPISDLIPRYTSQIFHKAIGFRATLLRSDFPQTIRSRVNHSRFFEIKADCASTQRCIMRLNLLVTRSSVVKKKNPWLSSEKESWIQIYLLYLLEKLKTTTATTDEFAEPRKAPTLGGNHVALNLVKTIRSIEENRHDAQQNAIFNELRQFRVDSIRNFSAACLAVKVPETIIKELVPKLTVVRRGKSLAGRAKIIRSHCNRVKNKFSFSSAYPRLKLWEAQIARSRKSSRRFNKPALA